MNPRELDVLNILWSTDRELTSSDIVSGKKGLTQSTVIAVLRKLIAEELVEVAGVTHSGKVLSRTYRPTEASKEAVKVHLLNQYSMFKNVIAPEEMCEAISKEAVKTHLLNQYSMFKNVIEPEEMCEAIKFE